MAEYKILFVDEVEADIRRFQRYVYKNDIDKFFELITMTPENSLENFMKEIKEENFDAIITDHKLHEENACISFDGIDLVREIFKEKVGFPCFVLTSFDDEAVENGDDVNIVYIKGLMDKDGESKAHATFLRKIESQIKHYRKRIKIAQLKLLELVEKSKEKPLNAKEEAKLLELDSFIEKSTSQKSAIPEHLKGTRNLDELHKMINSTDKLLEELKKLN
jgi:DNA-binding NarL/FixJ family response regulator